ncbi:hypothetical protein [Yersinia rohdei]|uniref:Uncharacterized protein n=1 Tax=Yersinia rohdei TaxID=29485 RepID=A0A0U1HX50_YERRO|nr:hypothetical protein [Yersinia rohdei]CQI96161.1 Uncharacterised protein [Yersinia rohdei]CQJ56034.1 Uncharacterised protein [Yersinia enterocolitica]
MNINLGEWVVKALELFERSKTLRRMYYSTVLVGILYGVASVLSVVRWW